MPASSPSPQISSRKFASRQHDSAPRMSAMPPQSTTLTPIRRGRRQTCVHVQRCVRLGSPELCNQRAVRTCRHHAV
eukprot:2515170-Rhodomonas_salina.3